MLPHTIRLREPWESDPGTLTQGVEGSGVDHREVPPGGEGRAVYRRRFNRPTNLDAWERVALEIDRAIFAGEVMLNGKAVGRMTPGELFSVDVTTLLEAQNELAVTVLLATRLSHPPESSSIYARDPNEPLGSPVGDVQLVIRTAPAE